ncbi:MAG: Sugar transporter permease [Chloroflexi bacterium]|jgi:multiple sugar transport system permease protein|nr:Sugar transporter permease [Chloroflexota bacterium]
METNTSVKAVNQPSATRQVKARANKKVPVNWRDAFWGYILIAPAFIFIIGFTFIPVIGAFGISLTKWDLLSQAEFIGFDNYQRIFSDNVATKTLLNTFYYTFVSVPLGIIISLLLASLLNQKIRGLAIFRTFYYLPVISSTVAVSMIFRWVLDSQYGMLNGGLAIFGISPIPWLTDPAWAMPAVILVTVWRSLGFNMLVLLAALQDVPKELHEAAAMDGATAFHKFFYVSIPLITPAIFFVTMTSLINSFQSFDLVYNMTQGGPARATSLIGYYLWEQAFKYLNMGYGAAIAFVLFFFILVITFVQWVLRRKWVFGEE